MLENRSAKQICPGQISMLCAEQNRAQSTTVGVASRSATIVTIATDVLNIKTSFNTVKD